MKYYASPNLGQYSNPATKTLVAGVLSLLLAIFSTVIAIALANTAPNLGFARVLAGMMYHITMFSLVLGILAALAALWISIRQSEADKIRLMIRKRLFSPEYGNPLHLKEGERLPKIKCWEIEQGIFEITITTTCCTANEIREISSSISAALNGKYAQYAVTETYVETAFNSVGFRIEDVKADKSITVHSADALKPHEHTKLIVQKGTYIDLATSGSMIFAGKTRSGKTTGVISILMQALTAGHDNYGSQIVIVDPKQAELSRLPHTVTLDEDGEARGILEALKQFADTIKERQRVLNDLSEEKGDAVHWWEANFHVSFLFIDEYVALRSIFPKRAVKEDGGYNLAEFDALIKRIVTMGASAGCYAIISIAEASVEEGGLPAMLRSACTTKILFKPTPNEGRLLWDSEKLRDLPQRVYNAGEAWFSSTDGIHDNVSCVHFPRMDFPVYRELGRLLEEYYKG